VSTQGWLNQLGILQGGVWAVLMQEAADDLSERTRTALEAASLSLTYLRPGRNGTLVSTTARQVHHGSRSGVVECTGLDAAGTVCVHAVATSQH
jgi:uncharacterized protein (TIGR00369 family)